MIDTTKPPLGVTPKHIWDERRKMDLIEGLLRFLKHEERSQHNRGQMLDIEHELFDIFSTDLKDEFE